MNVARLLQRIANREDFDPPFPLFVEMATALLDPAVAHELTSAIIEAIDSQNQEHDNDFPADR